MQKKKKLYIIKPSRLETETKYYIMVYMNFSYLNSTQKKDVSKGLWKAVNVELFKERYLKRVLVHISSDKCVGDAVRTGD